MNEPDPAHDKSDGRGASVLLNGIAVLRSFTATDVELRVSEIARRVGLHKSTVSRILATLHQQGLVERDPETRRFRLGLEVVSLAGPLLSSLDVRRVAYPVLQNLADRTGETSALLLWNGTASVCVEQVPGRHLVGHSTPVGTRLTHALSASVQVFLGSQPEAEVAALLGNGTISDPSLVRGGVAAYLSRIREAAATGFAVNYGETLPDEVGVAAPVFDHRGCIAAAAQISAPRFRISRDALPRLGAMSAEAALEITTALGGNASNVTQQNR
ncbi:MAG: IclR family transcriptional regulator [Microbacteriaceae bacterium]